MSGVKGTQERFHFMDGIRGIAAAMIVVHHAFSANIAAFFVKIGLPLAGYYFQNTTGSGVDLFFVLSGVVLLRPYLRGQRKLEVLDYFKRRIIRIYPPYFFALVFGAFVVWFNNVYPTWYNELGMRMGFSWQETFKEAGIISTNEGYYNLAWWSLQIEVLFYALAPLIIFVFPKPGRLSNRVLVITIMLSVIATIALQQLFTMFFPHLYTTKTVGYVFGNVPMAVIRQTVWRFVDYPACFLLGVLLAAKDFSRRAGWILMGVGAAIVAISPVYWFIIQAGYGLFYAGIIILAFNSATLKSVLSKPIMMWLGERSYSLFLIHLSVFYLVNNLVSRITPGRNFTYGMLTRGIGIPLAIFAAMLLFNFVERRQAKGLITAKYFWPWQANRLKRDMLAEKEVIRVKEEVLA
jgi:peptidoglycan/LPS O-acetylase OafA/YrhL